jgi:hypothetical protein
VVSVINNKQATGIDIGRPNIPEKILSKKHEKKFNGQILA